MLSLLPSLPACLENPTTRAVLASVLVAGLTFGVYRVFFSKKKKEKKNYPKDTIVIHQFPRGIRAPSASPFPIKLETWVRINGLKYENEFSMFRLSSKGKCPFITFNGAEIDDSQFCIDYLKDYFNKDLNKHLSEEERAIARAFVKMTEESLYWVLVCQRYKYDKPEDCGLSPFMFKLITRTVKKYAHGQGYGRHTQEEVYKIGKADLKAIDKFIGNKKFLMGDQVCEEDCSIFGMLCQIYYHVSGPLNEFVTKECPNMNRYMETMKAAYWPDWDQQLARKKN